MEKRSMKRSFSLMKESMKKVKETIPRVINLGRILCHLASPLRSPLRLSSL